ncbi:hypothetical protein H4219_004373 [Mycoemilia scoparia]|uniref:Uncharacterized protein n=1 Tax=Mycoemilia scoparia TaxID=417184 RepID=A0A9W7ZSR2_9FUNG|nr:hypothetical protein H4219_004373 [Mycoemilia scoparia]
MDGTMSDADLLHEANGNVRKDETFKTEGGQVPKKRRTAASNSPQQFANAKIARQKAMMEMQASLQGGHGMNPNTNGFASDNSNNNNNNNNNASLRPEQNSHPQNDRSQDIGLPPGMSAMQYKQFINHAKASIPLQSHIQPQQNLAGHPPQVQAVDKKQNSDQPNSGPYKNPATSPQNKAGTVKGDIRSPTISPSTMYNRNGINTRSSSISSPLITAGSAVPNMGIGKGGNGVQQTMATSRGSEPVRQMTPVGGNPQGGPGHPQINQSVHGNNHQQMQDNKSQNPGMGGLNAQQFQAMVSPPIQPQQQGMQQAGMMYNPNMLTQQQQLQLQQQRKNAMAYQQGGFIQMQNAANAQNRLMQHQQPGMGHHPGLVGQGMNSFQGHPAMGSGGFPNKMQGPSGGQQPIKAESNHVQTSVQQQQQQMATGSTIGVKNSEPNQAPQVRASTVQSDGGQSIQTTYPPASTAPNSKDTEKNHGQEISQPNTSMQTTSQPSIPIPKAQSGNFGKGSTKGDSAVSTKSSAPPPTGRRVSQSSGKPRRTVKKAKGTATGSAKNTTNAGGEKNPSNSNAASQVSKTPSNAGRKTNKQDGFGAKASNITKGSAATSEAQNTKAAGAVDTKATPGGTDGGNNNSANNNNNNNNVTQVSGNETTSISSTMESHAPVSTSGGGLSSSIQGNGLLSGDAVPTLDINALTNGTYEYNYFSNSGKPGMNMFSQSSNMGFDSSGKDANGLSAEFLTGFSDSLFQMPNDDSMADFMNFGGSSAADGNGALSLGLGNINFEELMSQTLGRTSEATIDGLMTSTSMLGNGNNNNNNGNTGTNDSVDNSENSSGPPAEKQSAKA